MKTAHCQIGLKSLIVTLMMGAVGMFAVPALADDKDQDRARAAMLRGEVEPLPKALLAVEKSFKGDVIEVELEEEDKFGIGPTLIYEIKLLTPEGNVLQLKVHAKTLEILDVDGNDNEYGKRDD